MKKNNKLSITIFITLVSFFSNPKATAQFWHLNGGDPIYASEYLGGDATSTIPLLIKNRSNYPINFGTNDMLRMKLNHNVSYPINGAPGTNIGREGYLLLGTDNSFNSTSNPIYNTGAFSLLHLNGKSNGIDELGYRNWMQTGITLTGNQDLSYMGLRQVGEKEDLTETTIAWADDGSGELGPDDLVFRFLGGNPGASSVSSNFSDPSDLDGVNIARFTPSGQIGFGNTFGLTADHINYVRPQNLLHLSIDGKKPVYLQVTNQSATGQTATDGLHIGYAASNLEAQIIQKENANLTLFTNNTPRFTIAGGGNVGVGSVFTTAAQPQNLFHVNNTANNASFMQVTNQSGTGQTATDGLHIGYAATSANNFEAKINQRENDRLSLFTNSAERMRIMHTGALNNGVAFNPGGLAANLTRIGISHNPSTPVTRPLSLLHLGYNVANSSSNDGWRSWMDVGMFASQSSDYVYLGLDTASNGADAILAWGDNPANDGSGSGPDNFKMVFTSPLNDPALFPAATQSGVEGLRMTPSLQGINTGIGGDAANGNPYHGSSTNATATLEVNAWGSTNGNSGLRFTDLNSAATPIPNPGSGVLSVNTNGDVVYVEANNAPNIGNYCGSTPKPLTSDFEVPLNDKNYYFSGQGTNPDTGNIKSSVGIGLNCGTNIPYAKLQVLQSRHNSANHTAISVSGQFDNDDSNGKLSIGVLGRVYNNPGHPVYGGAFSLNNSIPMSSVAGSAAVYCNSVNAVSNGTAYALLTDGISYFNGDAYFYGDVHGSQYAWSDSVLKTNVDSIPAALAIINRLKPVSYNFDSSYNNRFHFSPELNYGFIAQQLERVLPSLVKTITAPALIDSLGNITDPALSYKSLNYQGVIPILTKAIQEQQAQLTGKDSLINGMNKRLTQLEYCIANANLCNNFSVNSYKTDPNAENTNYQTVNLSNLQTIILNQNTPNPFAEQTTISYFLPDNIKTAAIIFYNAEGREINRAEIATRGKGAINVYAQDLSSGVYSYTLIADGNVIDTKRMVKR